MIAGAGSPFGLALWLAFSVVLAVVGVVLLKAHSAPLARRARALGAGGAAPAGSTAGQAKARVGALLISAATAAQSRIRLPASLVPDPGGKLAQAGYRSGEAKSLFLAAILLLPPAAALAGAALLPLVVAGLSPLLALLLGGAAGVAAPSLWLRNKTTHRQQAIRTGFPDMLDLFVICVEAGLSPDAAMARVARELAPALPELADEIGLTAIELGFLPNRRDAFTNLERRVPIEEVRNFVALFQQTERYGTPLAAALRTQAAETRAAALMRVEERAARLPAILTVPMILFILPPLFIVLIGPVVVQLLAM